MPISPPPYRQIENLLWFLKVALRGDEVLQEFLGSEGAIVGATAESLQLQTGGQDRDEEMPIFDCELPMLAAFETDSRTIHRAGQRGDEVTVELWYAFDLPVSGAGLRSEEWGARIAKLVCWRIREHLHRGTFDHGDDPYDLYSDGKIEQIDLIERRLIEHDRYGGFAAQLKMTHFEPPYTEASLVTLTSVELDLEETETDTVLVEGDVELDA